MSQLPRPTGRIPVRSGIPQPASRIPNSGIPKPSGIARPTLLGKSVQETIVAHKLKQQNAQLIKKRGTYGNIIRADELLNAPKVVTKQQVGENMRDLGTRMQQQKLVGVVKKYGAAPLPNTAFIPADVVKSKLTHRKVLQQVASPNKLHEQYLERQKTEANKAMKNSFMGALGISLEDEEVPDTERQFKASRKVEDLKQGQIGIMCNQYSTLVKLLRTLQGPENEEKKRIEKIKFLEKIESDLPMLLTMIRMAVGKEHWEKYNYEENAKRMFIKMIRDYFVNNPNPNSCRKELGNLMKKLPSPIKKVEQPAEREPLTPLAALRRPVSNPALSKPASRLPGPSRLQPPSRMPQPSQIRPQRTLRPPSAPAKIQRSTSPARPVPVRPTTPRSAESSRTPDNVQRPIVRSASPRRPHSTPSRMNKSATSTPIQGQGMMRQPQNEMKSPVEKIREKVTHGLKQLQVMKSRDRNSKTIKQKLSQLTKHFCAIYAANHNMTRFAGFEVWSKAFLNNINPILDDLEAYYKELPHASRKFNREQVAYQFHSFLRALYNDTKRLTASKGDCEKMVSNRVAASAELARLKKLQIILKEFVQQIQELLGPYVPEGDDEEEAFEEEPVQHRPAPRKLVFAQSQPRILQLQAQGAGMKPLPKVPSKTVQRRPLMRPRGAEPAFSPIPRALPQPRRTPEKIPDRPKPRISVTPPSKKQQAKPPPTVVEMDRLSPPKTPVIPKRTPPVVVPNSRSRVSSPFDRSFDTTPKFLKNEVIQRGKNKTIAYKPTRLDMIKFTGGLDLVQKLSNLEERVQRAVSPTYRPISPGSPGRDNLPFNRTYSMVADTSFQSPDREEAVVPNKLRRRWSQGKRLEGTIQPDEPTQSEAEASPESEEDEPTLAGTDNTLVKTYVSQIDDKWDTIDQYFCTILTNPQLHSIQVEADIDALIGDLKSEIIDVLYGWNDKFFAQEMETVRADFLRMNKVMRKCLQRMRTEKISLDDCQDIISGDMEVHGLPDTDLRHQLHDAFDHLEYVKDKYRRKILAGEAQGHLYKLDENIPEPVDTAELNVNRQRPLEIRETDSKKQLSDIYEDDDDDDEPQYYYDSNQRPIEIKKRLDAPPEEDQAGPSRFVNPAEIKAAVYFPDEIEDPPLYDEGRISDSSDEEPYQFTPVPKIIVTDSEGRSELFVERQDKLKEALPEFVLGLGAPDLLIERDILHVACQLTDREVSDLPLPYDNLTKSILEVARAYKQAVVEKEKALELIGNTFWRLPCVPIEFTNTFIYHPTNSFFGELEVNDPALNAALRANLMNERALRQCEESQTNSSNAGMDFSSYVDKTWYNIFTEDEASDIARELENSMKEDAPNDLDLSLGDVSIADGELSNSGDEFLAIPSSINFSYESSVITDEEQMSLLSYGGVPDQKLAMETLVAELDALDERLDKQLKEGQNHIENSAIYGKGIKHILHPTILERHNYYQARGSDIPTWFPGMYTVFQDSFELKPFVHNDENNVFLHAWRTMAPHIDSRAA